jgi:TolA-binding protein
MGPLLEKLYVALIGLIGGAAFRGVTERMQEARQLRHSVDRLALGVEAVPQQLAQLQAEIHRVGARNEAQLERLNDEMRHHQEVQERRFELVEDRLAETSRRIDSLVVPPLPPPPGGLTAGPGLNLRVDRERRCFNPEYGRRQGGQGNNQGDGEARP